MLFAHISYTSFRIQMSSGKNCKNVAEKKFKDFKKLEGTFGYYMCLLVDVF